jgi:hypothetical protein
MKWTEEQKRKARELRERSLIAAERHRRELAASKIHVGVSVKFETSELIGWPIENVKAFMGGIADVLAVQPQVEGEK